MAMVVGVLSLYSPTTSASEPDLDGETSFVGIQQGFGYRGRGEGICLDKDLLLGLTDCLIDCIGTAPIRTEIDMDGGVLGKCEISGISGLKGNQKNDEQKGSKDTLHGLALLCDASNAPEL
jgi:hypothetical protein